MESDQEPASGQRIELTIDHRERSSGVPEALSTSPQLELSFALLPTGDYRIRNSILIERKTLRDFACSIRDGRLFAQAWRLAQSSEQPAFILEGVASDLAGSRMRREPIIGAIASLNLTFGVPVLRSRDPKETALLLLYIAQQMFGAPRALARHSKRRAKGMARAQLNFLQRLPGIGPARARALLHEFGSIERVICADPRRLCQVPGIGLETAERIRRLVGDPQSQGGRFRKRRRTGPD